MNLLRNFGVAVGASLVAAFVIFLAALPYIFMTGVAVLTLKLLGVL